MVRIEDLDSNFKELEREDGTLDTVTEDELDGVHLHRNQDDVISKDVTSERVKKFFDYFNLRVALPWLQALTKKVNELLKAIKEKVWSTDLEEATKEAKNYADEKAKAIEERIEELPTAEDITEAKEEAIADANGKLEKKADVYVSDAVHITQEKLTTEGDQLPFYKFTASESAGGLKIVTNNEKLWVGWFHNGIETIVINRKTEHYEVPILKGYEYKLQFMESEGLDVSVYLETDVKGLCKTVDEALKKSASYADEAMEKALKKSASYADEAMEKATAAADGKLAGKANVYEYNDEIRCTSAESVSFVVSEGAEKSGVTIVNNNNEYKYIDYITVDGAEYWLNQALNYGEPFNFRLTEENAENTYHLWKAGAECEIHFNGAGDISVLIPKRIDVKDCYEMAKNGGGGIGVVTNQPEYVDLSETFVVQSANQKLKIFMYQSDYYDIIEELRVDKITGYSRSAEGGYGDYILLPDNVLISGGAVVGENVFNDFSPESWVPGTLIDIQYQSVYVDYLKGESYLEGDGEAESVVVEEWEFTLEDGTTVTKRVVVG